jgi:prephenate dehydratase
LDLQAGLDVLAHSALEIIRRTAHEIRHHLMDIDRYREQ